jgi:hypothetical protein
MNEQHWLTCVKPEMMLAFLSGRASERKLLLLAAACCRRFATYASSFRRGLDAIEGYVDGRIYQSELLNAWEPDRNQSWDQLDELDSRMRYFGHLFELQLEGWRPSENIPEILQWCRRDKITESNEDAAESTEEQAQCDLIRDVIGNPFRQVHVDPAWLKWNGDVIRKVAQAVYDARRFEELSVLADALEEAGCAEEAILTHCRQPGVHVCGCWVLDLLVSKA